MVNEVFELNHDWLASDIKLAILAGKLGRRTRIDSPETFNQYCREACRLWQELFGTVDQSTTELFTNLLDRVACGGAGTIPTSWGGVVVTLHEPPRVEKYLVIRQDGYLALEKHAEKDEHLEVLEGTGLLLSRIDVGSPLMVEVLEPGRRHHFKPGQEHCLIGTRNFGGGC